jgi:hypothetical protein
VKLNYPKLTNWFFSEDFSKIFGYHETSSEMSCSYFSIVRMVVEQEVLIVWSSNDERYILQIEDINEIYLDHHPNIWNTLISLIERN